MFSVVNVSFTNNSFFSNAYLEDIIQVLFIASAVGAFLFVKSRIDSKKNRSPFTNKEDMLQSKMMVHQARKLYRETRRHRWKRNRFVD